MRAWCVRSWKKKRRKMRASARELDMEMCLFFDIYDLYISHFFLYIWIRIYIRILLRNIYRVHWFRSEFCESFSFFIYIIFFFCLPIRLLLAFILSVFSSFFFFECIMRRKLRATQRKRKSKSKAKQWRHKKNKWYKFPFNFMCLCKIQFNAISWRWANKFFSCAFVWT